MAKCRVSSSSKPEYHPRGFVTILASAFLEWLLIFLLFGNGVFSYVITKFARYCNLPLPCLLCSRLDNVMGNQRVEYFRDLFCSNHQSEISQLVLCHAHCKLANVHGMCETCLFSFATINKSNSETYRLLVGKLGDNPESDIEQEPLIKGNKHGNTRQCCCCNELWCPKGYPENLLRTCSVDHDVSHLDIPLTRDIGRDLLQHKQKSRRPVEASDVSHEYHVGYSELKITSDAESEVVISEYESNTAHNEINDPKLEETKPVIITLTDDVASKKLVLPSSEPDYSTIVAHPQLDSVNTASSTAPGSRISMHGLEELNWHLVEPKVLSESPAELITFDDLPPPDVCETIVEGGVKISEVMHTSIAGVAEEPKEVNDLVCDLQSESKKDSELQSSKSLDLGDAYNIAIGNGNKGRQTSSSFGERNINNSAKISEDLKQLLSQISRGTDLPSFDMSPRVSRNLEELKHSDSSTTGMQMLQKRISLERNESGLESLDGSVSEVEGESPVDRLKRQIEHDKKLLLALYKELEEERSASAIAANQAMAMMTRLQEEKAALHMDASQYLRMMEEQAEYDMEALQNANDLLAEREVEIQALEAELEHYRGKYPDEATLLAKAEPSYESTEKDSKVDQSEARPFEDSSFARNFTNPKNVEGLRTSFRDQMKSSFLERENERTFVSDLSNKLKELSENEIDSTAYNDNHPTHEEETGLHIKELNHSEELARELEESGFSNQEEGSTCKQIVHAAENRKIDVVSSRKEVSSPDVNYDAIPALKSAPNSPENQHKGWHIVQDIDLEEDKGKGVQR
uniref:GTD-binding domain-containing protein n=1 Tax=Kalanchoe fedtschenkoi TaxID=63787 RepID=A0A7N0TVX3_KALFE